MDRFVNGSVPLFRGFVVEDANKTSSGTLVIIERTVGCAHHPATSNIVPAKRRDGETARHKMGEALYE